MSKGGARSNSGPAPDPNALRREYDQREWTRLPKEGCTLEPPAWPIEFGTPTQAELSMWDRLWHMPQAVVWHNDGVADMVSHYVRQSIRGSEPDAPGTVLNIVKQLAELLLLSIPALRMARYYIAGSADEAALASADQANAPAVAKTGTDDAAGIRGRFHVVKPKDDDDDDDSPRLDV